MLPFLADSFGWEAFERFCGAWLVSGATLPNLNLNSNPAGPARLRIVDAQRLGTAGAKQHGIDILVRMETGARWVVQCKHVKKFGKTDLEKAIVKAEKEFGLHNAEHFLLWVTGDVSTDATLLADDKEKHPNWTLWSAERLTNEFILHTPRRQCFTILQQCFDHACAKAFFPIPDDLLITATDFFARWDGPDRSFHHHAVLMGRESDLVPLADFAKGGDGTKALILSAPGGVGKSRLLKAMADQVAADYPGRSVLFVNPEASPDADLPRYEDLTKLTIIHDDAHRTDVPGMLLAMMAQQQSSGSRLILSTRPGVEDSLRERLMNDGYPAKDIDTIKLKKLSSSAMVELAASLMGDVVEEAPRILAKLSGGCALITVVGAELIRKGELQSLDLHRSENFAHEVFTRFEGQELDRASGSLDRTLLKKLLRSIALLSPWQGKDTQASNQMAEFIGESRGRMESACDSLLKCGLLVTTHEGMRVAPDLFSDHLVYASCYSETGQATEFIGKFLEVFGTQSTMDILRNLAEAQWRAVQMHGPNAGNVIAPLWKLFFKKFEEETFWERSRLLEKWKDFAIYLPRQSIELAEWAMDLQVSPPMQGYDSLNSHDRVLAWLPHVLKPIAIWSDEYRQQALDLLWRLETEFPKRESASRNSYEAFAEIASFRYNFPQASSGVLDWLESKLAGEDGLKIADSPCGLLQIVLRPFFARTIEINYWQDRRTLVNVPHIVPISSTKDIRRRAMSLIVKRIIPRGTVAAVNVLPVLGHAIRSATVGYDALEPSLARAWSPERKLALQALQNSAALHQNHWVHFVIRNQVKWHIVYGKDERWRTLSLKLVSGLMDTFEMRLARLTLSSAHEDSLKRYESDQFSAQLSELKMVWHKMLQETVAKFLKKKGNANTSKLFLEGWLKDAARHGFEARFEELFSELARQNQEYALSLLDEIMNDSESCLSRFASNLLHPEGGACVEAVEARVKRGLMSENETIARSFMIALQCFLWLQTDTNISAMLKLAKIAEGSVLWFFIRTLDLQVSQSWIEQLNLILARRSLDIDQTRGLAHALAKIERYGGGKVSDAAIDALLERLEMLPSLSGRGEEEEFLHWLAEKHSAKLYSLFLRRIDIAEKSPPNFHSSYEAMPSHDEISLSGLAESPNFENLANELLDTIFSRPHNSRSSWTSLFIVAVSRTTPLIESLLTRRLAAIKTEDDLEDLAVLLRFEGSVLAYRYPMLVEGILTKARTLGPSASENVMWCLIHASRLTMRGYTNGELNSEYRYALLEAEKAAAIYSDHATLGPFYRKIVEIEMADAERQKRIAEASFESDW